MSQRAWLRSSSLRMRNVMQPEFGTQWCSSARLSANNVSRTERGMVRQRSHSYGRVRPPHLLTGIPFRRSGEDEQRRAPTPTLPVRVSSLEVSWSKLPYLFVSMIQGKSSIHGSLFGHPTKDNIYGGFRMSSHSSKSAQRRPSVRETDRALIV